MQYAIDFVSEFTYVCVCSRVRICLCVLALGIIWCVVQMSEPLVLLIAVPYHA
jgi:hypothetical protein